MKLWAASQGISFISWRLGNAENTNPIQGLQELFTLAVYKSKEALFNGNETMASSEAVRWSKLSMDLARLLKAYTMDDNEERRDLDLALESVLPSFEGFANLKD